MKNLVFVTSNRNKLKEAESILGVNLKQADVDIDEIQTIHPEEVVEDKARKAYKIVKKPVFVEDTGLYFLGWNKFPGALIKYLLKALGTEGIVKALNGFDRKALAVTCICYYNGKRAKVFRGEIEGKVPKNPKGETNFGWDPIFIPNGYRKTFAEMTTKDKNEISHRMRAFVKFRSFLKKQ